MSLPKMTTAVDNISKLDTRPNAVNGLTADELKAKFDKAPEDIKRFLNEVLVPALDGAITLDALGAVPETRKVNGKTLDADVTLDAADIDYAGTIFGAANVKEALEALNAKKDVAVFSATLYGETLSSAATFPEISAAYSAGKQVLLKVLASGGAYWLLPLVRFLGGMVASFAAWVSNSRLAVATLSYSAASTPPVNAWSMTQVPLSAESVAYSGGVGDAGSSPNTVSNVANALVALTVGEPLNVTANFVDSGAASVAEWAVAGSGDYYNIGEGYYIIATTDTRYYVRILGIASMTQRIVQIWKQGRVNIEPTVEIWQCTAHGATPEMLLRYETYRGDLTIPNQRWDWQVPDYRSADAGRVLMASGRDARPSWGRLPIPTATAADAGKIVTVGTDGNYALTELPKYDGGVS